MEQEIKEMTSSASSGQFTGPLVGRKKGAKLYKPKGWDLAKQSHPANADPKPGRKDPASRTPISIDPRKHFSKELKESIVEASHEYGLPIPTIARFIVKNLENSENLDMLAPFIEVPPLPADFVDQYEDFDNGEQEVADDCGCGESLHEEKKEKSKVLDSFEEKDDDTNVFPAQYSPDNKAKQLLYKGAAKQKFDNEYDEESHLEAMTSVSGGALYDVDYDGGNFEEIIKNLPPTLDKQRKIKEKNRKENTAGNRYGYTRAAVPVEVKK